MKRNIYKDLLIIIVSLIVIGGVIFVYFKIAEQKTGLTIKDRTILAEIYMGMPADSLEILLEKNAEKRLVYISDLGDMWSVNGMIPGNARAEFTTDVFNFSNWPTHAKHVGIFKSVTLNNRISEIYVMLGSMAKNAKPGDGFNQMVSDQILRAIHGQLAENYGKDSSIYTGLETYSTIDLRSSSFGRFVSGITKITRFKSKFGYVDLMYGIPSNTHVWNKVPDLDNPGSFSYEYFTMNAPKEIIPNEESVWLLPCIHYVVDPKYYEELKLNLKL